MEKVSAVQVTALIKACCPEAALYPAEDADFEAWFFCREGEYPDALPGQKPEGAWSLGFFDRDAGYWLYMDGEGGASAADDLPLADIGLQGIQMGECAVTRQAGPIAITALTLPEDVNMDAFDTGWNSGEISHAELVALMDRTQEEVAPRLYPAADVTFDRWCWVDYSDGKLFDWNKEAFPQALKAQAIGDSRDWLLAMVDLDGGLLVLYEYDE